MGASIGIVDFYMIEDIAYGILETSIPEKEFRLFLFVVLLKQRDKFGKVGVGSRIYIFEGMAMDDYIKRRQTWD